MGYASVPQTRYPHAMPKRATPLMQIRKAKLADKPCRLTDRKGLYPKATIDHRRFPGDKPD